MALRLALGSPDYFAGVLSIGGGLPTTARPLARLHEVRGLNVFLATGRESAAYPESEVCANLRLLHAAGMSLNLRLYPGGDDVTTGMLADMDRWIMEHVAAQQPAAQDQPSRNSY
jgi:phospholipase/carboxylesterase